MNKNGKISNGVATKGWWLMRRTNRTGYVGLQHIIWVVRNNIYPIPAGCPIFPEHIGKRGYMDMKELLYYYNIAKSKLRDRRGYYRR